jgi:uncharacterized protein YkwD
LILLTALVIASMTLMSPAPVRAAAPDPSPRFTVEDLDGPLQEMYALINRVRTRRDLHRLKPDACLTNRVAQPWADELARTRVFRHSDLHEGRRICRVAWIGENLAKGFATPRQAMRAFMRSPGHRRNLLTPRWRAVGLGVAVDRNGSIYWSQNFSD